MILAPLVRGRKGQHQEVFERVRKAGFLRARVDGVVVDVNDPPELAPAKVAHIEAVIDRVVVREGVRSRLAESINLAVRHGDGLVLASHEEKTDGGPAVWHDELFSTLYACPDCKIGYEELEPRTLQFQQPLRRLPGVRGLGRPRGLRSGAGPARRRNSRWPMGRLLPWKDVAAGGAAEVEEHPARLDDGGRLPLEYAAGKTEAEALAATAPRRRQGLSRRAGAAGKGIRRHQQRIEAAAAGDVSRRSGLPGVQGRAAAARGPRGPHRRPGDPRGDGLDGRRGRAQFFAPLAFAAEQQPVAQPILGEIAARLEFLDRVGLEYLTLDRPAGTLSGGELQRVRLASGLGSGLVGVCYVLDEPSIGLHPRDNHRLIEALRNLQARGNTVVVVEHDETIMRQADWLVDLGPGAGRHGGRVVAQGTPAQVAAADSLTGRYLAGRERIPLPAQRRRIAATPLDHHRGRDDQQPQERDACGSRSRRWCASPA